MPQHLTFECQPHVLDQIPNDCRETEELTISTYAWLIPHLQATAEYSQIVSEGV